MADEFSMASAPARAMVISSPTFRNSSFMLAAICIFGLRRGVLDATVNSKSPMSPIAERFAGLKRKGEKALVTFVTAGDPSLSELPSVLRCLEEGGADVVEVGLPFSDPIADGPTIQASSQRALERGVTIAAIFDTLASARLSVPIVLMGYTNIALRHGYADFSRRALECGASGVILSDLTPDEADEWKRAADSLDTIFLVAPTSTDERIKLACEASSGFVYCVSRTGVTGAGSEVPAEVRETVSRISKHTELPVCVGFGISSAEHVRMVCELADGAVVGSYLVDLLDRTWDSGKGSDELLQAVKSLKSGTKG